MKFIKRIELKGSHQKEKVNMWGDACVDELDGGVPSQCVRISGRLVPFKYLTVLFVNYTSIKLKNNKRFKLVD